MTSDRCNIRNLLGVRVTPNAHHNEITGLTGGALQVKIAAPPVKGKANIELIAFLSQQLGVGKGALTIIKGHTSRSKIITVAGLSQEDIVKRLLPE